MFHFETKYILFRSHRFTTNLSFAAVGVTEREDEYKEHGAFADLVCCRGGAEATGMLGLSLKKHLEWAGQ